MIPASLSSAPRLPALAAAALLVVGGLAASPAVWASSSEDGPPTLEKALAGLQASEGFLRTYRDPRRGRLLAELPPPNEESGTILSMLYVEGLTTGLGSNPVGLDRGQLGEVQVVDVRRLGPRVLFERRNLRFRAESDDPLERRATRQSFANSVIWAAPVEALDADGTSLIDLTSFLVRDAHQVEATLRGTGQGAYRLDVERSAIDFASCLSFPDNLEFEAALTYAQAGDEPGPLVAATAPTGSAFTLIQHYSLIRLPDDRYRPRAGDPRIGYFGPQYLDYAAPLDDSTDRWLISRHRLEKRDPG
ncbi:MAG: DUF5117 domain-containing protein, partial [Acidobacteriota bacterium]